MKLMWLYVLQVKMVGTAPGFNMLTSAKNQKKFIFLETTYQGLLPC